MNIGLSISPPNLVVWLSREERERNVVLIDLDADMEGTETLRLDVNVIFNPLPVRRGTLTRVDYYIGSTGAEVSVDASGGKVHGHTPAATLDVNYSNATQSRRKAGLTLKPEMKVKDLSRAAEAKLGSVTRAAGQERVQSAAFASAERVLAPVATDDGVKWTVSLPRGEKAVRDFLIGNLYLFAKCTWAGTTKRGRVAVRPSDVRFFDADRRPLGTAQSLVMQFVLWRLGIKLQNRDGFAMTFRETRL